MKRVTILDIAKEANVSKATVSRVLNETSAVHPDKKQAVLDAVKNLGFRPNAVARSLAKGRSMTIGVLTQLIGSPFFDAVAQGVIAGLTGTGYSPMFVDGRWDREVELEAVDALINRQVDGLLLIGGEVDVDTIKSLREKVPTIVVARNLEDHHHAVYTDNVDGGYQATKHLIDSGHRRIAIVQGLAHHPDAMDRLEGYKQALGEAKIAIDEDLICDGDFTAESGVRAVDNLVSTGTEFSAVFATNDMTAFGVRLALDRHGLEVPRQVSIVGFDDQSEVAYMTPPLTTMRQPAAEMGEFASKTLLDLIEGGTFESRRFGTELITRESVFVRPSS